MQLLALAAHDIGFRSDLAIAQDFGVGRTAITMRRSRAIAKLTADQRARYLSLMKRGPKRHKIKVVKLDMSR